MDELLFPDLKNVQGKEVHPLTESLKTYIGYISDSQSFEKLCTVYHLRKIFCAHWIVNYIFISIIITPIMV